MYYVWFYTALYTPKGSAKALLWGPIDSLQVIVLVNENWVLNFRAAFRQKKLAKYFYCTGGWVDGDYLPSLIFFKFKYVKK